MKNIIEYSTLNYYHTSLSDECLCLGVLIHNITTGQRDFRSITNFKRFQSFDDEADVEFVKMYLLGIKEEVEINLFNYESADSFDLQTYIKPFVNEFRFSSVKKFNIDETEDYVNELVKMFLRFDLPKRQRLSRNEEKQLVKRILDSNNLEYSTGKIKGEFQDDIQFDYQLGDNLFIKIFSFKGPNLKRSINSARQWSFAAGELENTKKVLFIYESDFGDLVNLGIIKNILSKHANVCNTDEALDYILQSLNS